MFKNGNYLARQGTAPTRFWLRALLASALLVSGPVARGQGFTLGDFETYGILINNGAANADINTFPVNANIGIGNLAAGKKVNLHNGVVNGKVDASGDAATVVTGGAITGTQPVALGGAPSPASVNSFVAGVQSAITAALGLSSFYGAEAGPGTDIVIHNTTQTIFANSGFLDATGTRVFSATSFSIGNGHTLTISGSATDYVVIDITGNSGNKLDGAVTLIGGIASDHVLFNFIGVGGSVQGAANGATLEGTFLIPNQKVQLNSLTISGHLFGGQYGQDFQFVSNARINQPMITTPVPEPETYAMLLAGLGLLGFAARRRRPQEAERG